MQPILENCAEDKNGLLQGRFIFCLNNNGAPICALLSWAKLKKLRAKFISVTKEVFNINPVFIFLSGLWRKLAAPKLNPLLVEEKPSSET